MISGRLPPLESELHRLRNLGTQRTRHFFTRHRNKRTCHALAKLMKSRVKNGAPSPNLGDDDYFIRNAFLYQTDQRRIENFAKEFKHV